MSVAHLALERAERGSALGPHEIALEDLVLDELPAINAAVPKSSVEGRKNLAAVDAEVATLVGSSDEPVLVEVAEAINLLELAYKNLEFDDSTDDDRQAHIVALEHLSRICRKPDLKGRYGSWPRKKAAISPGIVRRDGSLTLLIRSNKRTLHERARKRFRCSCCSVRTVKKLEAGAAWRFGGLLF